MELIERKIGEIFEFEGKKIIVKAASSDECDGCFFNTKCTLKSKKLSGECDRDWRNDRKSVIFVEQQEKIEDIKERKVGEIFEYKEKKLKVEEKASSDCYGCFFDEQHIPCSKNTLGYCGSEFRTDKKEVIFVEAKEQPQETEEIKERRVGEVFEYQGKKIRVEESSGCDGCFFKGRCSSLRREVIGHCQFDCRTDDKAVIFVEVKDEQPQEQAEQPQKLNLLEKLKYCPRGTRFWSPMLGNVEFIRILEPKIIVKTVEGIWEINPDSTVTIDCFTSPEPMLFPSREQRDWSKVKYEPREKKFNPNTLKPFDKIIARIDENGLWCCELFSFIEEGTNLIKGCGGYYKYCVPYNNDTMYLLNTANEVSEYYRYWEK